MTFEAVIDPSQNFTDFFESVHITSNNSWLKKSIRSHNSHSLENVSHVCVCQQLSYSMFNVQQSLAAATCYIQNYKSYCWHPYKGYRAHMTWSASLLLINWHTVCMTTAELRYDREWSVYEFNDWCRLARLVCVNDVEWKHCVYANVKQIKIRCWPVTSVAKCFPTFFLDFPYVLPNLQYFSQKPFSGK